MINPGSVGQPRDADPAPLTVCTTRGAAADSLPHRYDVEKAQEKIVQARFPPLFAERLAFGR